MFSFTNKNIQASIKKIVKMLTEFFRKIKFLTENTINSDATLLSIVKKYLLSTILQADKKRTKRPICFIILTTQAVCLGTWQVCIKMHIVHIGEIPYIHSSNINLLAYAYLCMLPCH